MIYQVFVQSALIQQADIFVGSVELMDYTVTEMFLPVNFTSKFVFNS